MSQDVYKILYNLDVINLYIMNETIILNRTKCTGNVNRVTHVLTTASAAGLVSCYKYGCHFVRTH
jgi:hypothetical protein